MIDVENMSPAELFDQYFGPNLFAPWTRVLLDYAQPRPGERVLDVACGTGTVARMVAPIVGQQGRVVGVDISPGMLNVARAAADGAAIEWREGDATALDLPDASFDLVVCQQGLQFFRDRAAAAREMARVLVPGGRLVVSLWQSIERQSLYYTLTQAQARHLQLPIEQLSAQASFSNSDAVRALLAESGFHDIEIAERTLNISFPSAEEFVYLTLYGGTAFLEEFDWNDEALRTRLLDNINHDIAPELDRYRSGDGVTFPTVWNLALAHV